MSGLNLVKKQELNLTKRAPSVSRYAVAMGWKEDPKIDLDVSSFLLGSNGKMLTLNMVLEDGTTGPAPSVVYFNQLKTADGSVVHSGDNRDGHDVSGNDDETILIDLGKLDPQVTEISFVATIYEAAQRGQVFDHVKDAFIRIYEVETGTEVAIYKLQETFGTATGVQFGSLTKESGEWKFVAVGAGYNADLGAFVQQYS